MRIDTYFTVPEVDTSALGEATVVVVDVVRATTTIVEALANGAKAIYPTESTEEAVRLASSMGREDTLLCGERKGLKIEGFDLGNSPREYTADVVGGKKHYARQPAEVKEICCGLKRSLIIAKFRTTMQLRQHLETMEWS